MSAALQNETTALVALGGAVSTILSADQNNILSSLRKELDGFSSDVTTERGRKEIASKARKVAVAKMDLVRLAGGLKEDAQKTIKAVNAEVRQIEEHMDALRDSIRAPLDAFEEAERARIAAHKDALAEIAQAAVFALPEPSPTEIELRLTVLEDGFCRQWQEFGALAQQARDEAHAKLTAMLVAAEAREAERAEIARLRAEAEERAKQDRIREQAERERQIAAQAAEQARVAAEQRAAEEARKEAARVAQEAARAAKEKQDAIDAAARREQEAADRAALAQRQAAQAEAARLAAIEQARRDAVEAERRAEERRAAAEIAAGIAQAAAIQAERDRIAAQQEEVERVAAQRAANKAHQARINGAAVASLEAIGLTVEQARAVVTAIARGQVDYVRVEY